MTATDPPNNVLPIAKSNKEPNTFFGLPETKPLSQRSRHSTSSN